MQNKCDIAKVLTQQQQKQAWYIQEVKNKERYRKIAQTQKEERYKVQKRGRATATRFDLAQGSHQVVEQVRKQTDTVRQKKKTDSISNKELNPT